MSFDPRVMEFPAWSAMTAPLLQSFGSLPNSGTEAAWQAWASPIAAFPEFGSLQIPDPRAFQDWRDWALILNEKIGFMGL